MDLATWWWQEIISLTPSNAMKGTSSFNESRLLAMKFNTHVFRSEHPMMDDGCVDCVGSVGCACLWSVDCLVCFVWSFEWHYVFWDVEIVMDGLKFRVCRRSEADELGCFNSQEVHLHHDHHDSKKKSIWMRLKPTTFDHFCSLLETCSIDNRRQLYCFVICGGSSLKERTKPSTAGRRPLPSGLKFY